MEHFGIPVGEDLSLADKNLGQRRWWGGYEEFPPAAVRQGAKGKVPRQLTSSPSSALPNRFTYYPWLLSGIPSVKGRWISLYCNLTGWYHAKNTLCSSMLEMSTEGLAQFPRRFGPRKPEGSPDSNSMSPLLHKGLLFPASTGLLSPAARPETSTTPKSSLFPPKLNFWKPIKPLSRAFVANNSPLLCHGTFILCCRTSTSKKKKKSLIQSQWYAHRGTDNHGKCTKSGIYDYICFLDEGRVYIKLGKPGGQRTCHSYPPREREHARGCNVVLK